MKSAFTLIELIIVIAIVAGLTSAVVLVLNPTEILRQGRDSIRLNDLDTLNRAISLYQTQRSSDPFEFGNPNTVYVSLQDTDGIFGCDEYSLPPLSSPWGYICRSEADLRNVDGSGWIPIDFTLLDSNNPLSRLPVDPINKNVGGFYYTYVAGGSWKLTAIFESEKLARFMAADGGPDPGIFEIGTDLNLANFVRGLVAYWKFDEQTDTSVAVDTVGSIHNGNVIGDGGSADDDFVVGRVGNAFSFDGNDDYINVDFTAGGLPTSQITIAAWIKRNSNFSRKIIQNEDWDLGLSGSWRVNGFFPNTLQFNIVGGQTGSQIGLSTTSGWDHFAVTYNGSNIVTYLNGSAAAPSPSFSSNLITSDNLFIGGSGPSNRFLGLMDDVRIYNRVLSSSEIKALYDSTK